MRLFYLSLGRKFSFSKYCAYAFFFLKDSFDVDHF